MDIFIAKPKFTTEKSKPLFVILPTTVKIYWSILATLNHLHLLRLLTEKIKGYT